MATAPVPQTTQTQPTTPVSDKSAQQLMNETLAASDQVLKTYADQIDKNLFNKFAGADGKLNHYERVLLANEIETRLRGTAQHQSFLTDLQAAGNTNGMGLNFGLADANGKALINAQGPSSDPTVQQAYDIIEDSFTEGLNEAKRNGQAQVTGNGQVLDNRATKPVSTRGEMPTIVPLAY
jgi:hypothetical protein